MKTKSLFLVATMLLMVTNLFAGQWSPSEKYAKFLPVFNLDKCWEFHTSAYNYQTSENLVDYPGYIAWSIRVFEEKNKTSDDYNLDWINLWLTDGNGNTHQIAYVQTKAVSSGDDDNCIPDKITDYNDNKTYAVHFIKCGDQFYLFMVTKCSYQTLNFITNSWDNLSVKTQARWDTRDSKGDDYKVFTTETKLDDVAKTRVTFGKPTVSNFCWTVYKEKTSLAFDYKVPSACTTIWWNLHELLNGGGHKGIVSSSEGEKTSGTVYTYPFEQKQKPAVADMYKAPFYLYAESKKVFTVDRSTFLQSCEYGGWTYNYPDETNTCYFSGTNFYDIPPFAQAKNFEVINRGDGSFDVTWETEACPTDKGEIDKSSFILEWSTDKTFKANVKSKKIDYRENAQYSYVAEFDEREKGSLSYYFRIYREHAAAGDALTQTITRDKVLTDYATVSGLTGSVDANNHVNLSWTISDGIISKNMKVQLKYATETKEFYAEDKNVKDTALVISDNLPTCDSIRFTVQMFEGDIARGAAKSINLLISDTVGGRINSYSVSKGFYNDRVLLRWTIDKDLYNFDYFQISRSDVGSDEKPILLSTVDAKTGVLEYNYEDLSCQPGAYYQYFITGFSTCREVVSEMDHISTIGFAQPYGVVSGKITFSGNQGVRDVAVNVVGDEGRRSRALRFYAANSAHISIPEELLHQMIGDEGTIEFFLKNVGSGRHAVIATNDMSFALFAENNTFIAGGNTAELNKGLFTHISITFKDKTLYVYANGELVFTGTNSQTCFTGKGFVLGGNGFDGFIDEIRIWNICRSQAEIKRTMNTYLTGKESGLTGYYRCDDEVEGEIFDISRKGSKFNEHHLKTPGVVTQVNHVPSIDQLSLKTYTDSAGNYLINNIPYAVDGSLYTIIPSLGVHEFSPSDRPLFFNHDAATHNSIDFTDVSSFAVEGTVMYYNTEYPVAGCRFYVDGQVCMQDSKMVESDEEGHFTIQVPIGNHYITIEKDGHTFCEGGRFPATGTYTFNKNENGLQFVDSTTVLMVGRVAGGDDEKNKPHGMGEGIANMGQAKIVLTPAIARNLNTDEKQPRTFEMPDSVKMMHKCQSVTTTGAKGGDGARSITILTDPATGEFVAALPPIDFEIGSIELINDKLIQFDKGKYTNPNLGSCNIYETSTDTSYIDSVNYRTLTYLYKLDAIHYADPELVVTQTNNKVGAFGERVYVIPDDNDTVVLYDTVGGALQYTLPAPVFLQNKVYRWNISAFETYTNKDVTPHLVYHQPMRKAIVTIANELGEKEVAADDGVIEIDGDSVEVVAGEIISLAKNQVQLDSAGMAEYAFVAGFPNIIAPFTYNVNISYTDAAGTRVYQWSENENCKGYVFGACTTGTNFVTEGPDQLLFVLRDPPGGQSYSTWEKGEKITTTHVSTMDQIAGTSDEELFTLGFSTKIGTGIGVIQFSEITNQNNTGFQEDYEHTWLGSSSTKFEITTTKTISTQPQYPAVGTPGDVFVGVGTNMLFGNARKVYLKKEDGKYQVDVKDVIATGQTFKTDFNYTTSDIEDNVIPNYIKMRNALLTYVDGDIEQYIQSHPNTDTVPRYYTNLKADDPRFGSDNHDSIIWKEKATPIDSLGGPSYVMVLPIELNKQGYSDQICHYNNQIGTWKHVLANNEEAKVMVHHSAEKVDWDAWDDAAKKAKEVTYYRDRLLDPSLDKETREKLEEEIKDNNIDTSKVMAADYYKGGWLIENVSLGGSVTVSSSRTRTSGEGHSDGHKNTFKVHLKNSMGFHINSLGSSITNDVYYGRNYVGEDGKETTNTTSVSYTLSPNDYEYMSIDVYAAPDGFGPIFSTRGGQTYCPYEDAEVTKYFEPGLHELHTQTVQMEKPRLRVSPTSLSDIPVGSKAFFTIEMTNEADINPDHYYWLRLYTSSETNPHGAQITVDGAYLTDDGRVFMFHPGSPITQTVAIAQSDPSVLDYDSIAIILASDCNRRDDADTVYLSAHFTPSCSPVELRIDKTTINSSTGNTLPIIIHGYDRNYRNFKSISLQYRGVGENDWSLIQKYYTDEKWHNPTDKTELPITGASITYQLEMADTRFPDGAYEFRVQTACAYGENTEVYNESEIITVIKDMQQPQSLGLPSPINGIYTADNQIYVEFNEPIQTGRIYDTNIKVTGVLNAQPIRHDVAYRLSPEQTFVTQTDAQYDLTAQDFAFVCWLYLEKDGMIMNHNNGGFSVQTDATGHLIVTLANKDASGIMPVRFRSNDTLPKNQWMYLAVMLNQTEKRLSAYIAYDAFDQCLIDKGTPFVYNQRGAVALGGETNMAQGAIHELQLWTGAMSWIGLKSMMYATKELYRNNLYGYWPMNEGEGRVLHEKMRNRHMLAPGASWYYADDNYAVRVPQGATAYMDISERNMDELTDYALEFWFRTDADGTLVTTDAADYMSVGLEEGKPYVATPNGRINLPVDQMYNDNQWHHLAILSHRLDNAQIVLDDAVLSLNTYNVLAGLRGAKMIFGDTISQLDIDEVRLWKASITAKWIQDNRRARVAGNQPGLITYYPMDERYTDHNIEFYRSSLADYAVDSLYNHTSPLQPATCTLQPDICNLQPISDAPAMRVDKHAVSVKHTFVASDTKIVINITEEPAMIEGTTLNISVSDIVDKHGNYSPNIKWTAYVNRNRLVWGQDQMYIEKEVLASKSFNVTFSNLSGETEDWMLENIPNYIQVSETGGTLRPQQSQTITITVLPSLAVGYYDPIIYLVGNEAIRTPLSLNIHVTGDKPDWSVRPEDYEYTMNLIGMPWATFMQPDTADMMAAFIGDKVAGVCHPQLLNPQTTTLFVMMDIYANLTQAEQDSINHNMPIHKQVTFRYWDASNGRVYVGVKPSLNDQPYDVNYQPNALVGSFDKPVLFDLDARIEQAVALRKGWNWYSFNVFPEATDITTALPELLPYINIMKSQEAFVKVDHVREAISGTLTAVDAYKLYKASSLADSTIHITGYPVDPLMIDIPIHKGWNWIGYVPQLTLSVSMALSNMEPAEGDIIKARSGFAVWHNNAWVGSLAAMTPGQGYMYFSGDDGNKSFHYPSYLTSVSNAPKRMLVDADGDYHYTPIPPSTYSGNMTMTAIVMDGNVQVTTAEVAFFAGDECRTTMKANPDDHYYFTIPGDETVVLCPRVWYNDEEYRPNQTFNFIEDADYGTFDEPIVIQLDPATDLNRLTNSPIHRVTKYIYNDHLYIRKNGKIYDVLGISL